MTRPGAVVGGLLMLAVPAAYFLSAAARRRMRDWMAHRLHLPRSEPVDDFVLIWNILGATIWVALALVMIYRGLT